MTLVRASAPGKLFLLGEYAVLDGAPALLVAVDRRSVVTAAPATAWRLTAREIGIDGLLLGPGGSLPPDLDAVSVGMLRLFDAVRRAVQARTGEGEPLDLVIDSAAYHHGGHKLGLGSSAAVAVALTAALAGARDVTLIPDELFSLADAAHRETQGGSGSGGDIAASVYGGRIRYLRGERPRQVGWPNDLALLAVVTGTGSSTVDLVGRVAAYRDREPTSYRRDLAALTGLAVSAGDALSDADRFLALADDYFRAIENLDAHSGAGIVTPRHRELRELAAASGAIFKSTGAGGGDLGLVFAKLEAVDELLSALAHAGADVIPVPPSSDGVRMEAAE